MVIKLLTFTITCSMMKDDLNFSISINIGRSKCHQFSSALFIIIIFFTSHYSIRTLKGIAVPKMSFICVSYR